MKRVLPAAGLFFLAPLVAEFLLGDLPINMLGALVILAPLYGGGALLIREVARRTGGGWFRIFALGLAYAIFEEAFTTQTLFNPNYLHLNLHLLQPAYIPALGIGGWWTVYVLTLHTVWSIAVSVALAEALVPDRAATPWLGKVGLAVTAVLFLFGAAASVGITLKQDRFMASGAQFAGAALVCVIIIAASFGLHGRRSSEGTAAGAAPGPWLAGAAALAAGSIFLVTPKQWAWGAVAVYALLDLAMVALVARWSRSAGWSGIHRLALAGGAALAYAWHAFVQTPAVGSAGMADRIGNAIFGAALIAVLAIAARRNSGLRLVTADGPGRPTSWR
ncbi:MAG TPA: hypothetical protein VMG35_14045 [Bryobacteraceae bacterium]|nr:hypothetical protein [Bryobacteraceae bacterium]